jgi:hypothetical protein
MPGSAERLRGVPQILLVCPRRPMTRGGNSVSPCRAGGRIQADPAIASRRARIVGIKEAN